MKKLQVFISFFVVFNLFFCQEKITFTSANPFSFRDIIKNLDNQTTQEVSGILTLPKVIDNEKFPLIIGVAGSLDWGEHHHKYLEKYRDMGIATFQLNSFTSRGIKSTVGTQTKVTTAMIILDVYKAFEALENHPNIDKDKVALTGWSLGGAVTLFSGWAPIKNAINSNLNFSAKLAFYPPCFAIPNNIDFESVPTHILIGNLDTWTPSLACQELEKIMQDNGYDFNVTVYQDSYHSFDRDSDISIIENAYSFSDCRLKIRDDGAVLMNFLNIPMTTPFLQKVGLSFCAERGTKIGGNKISRDAAFIFAQDFMSKHLLNK